MENQRNLLTISLIAISILLYIKWLDFTKPEIQQSANQIEQSAALPNVGSNADSGSIPNTPVVSGGELPSFTTPNPIKSDPAQLITVNTDLVVAVINTQGGIIERLELKKQPIEIDQPDNGFPLLKNTQSEIFVVEDGLIIAGEKNAPNHLTAVYQAPQRSYDIGLAEQLVIPLTWVSENGQTFTKTITFSRNSYLVKIDYQVTNTGTTPLSVFQYSQFKRTEPLNSGGGLTQLPSYTGGAIFNEGNLKKIDFGDMSDEKFSLESDHGWVSMMQHYFVGVFIPNQGPRVYYTATDKTVNPQVYRIGYNTKNPVTIAPGETGQINNQVFLGPKEQSRLQDIEDNLGVDGLSLTVDFGVFTVISKPLFWILDLFYKLVGNWGWAIVLTTCLIKLIFYPLSAKSYRSMAAMKKLQPRIQTLKERHKDDRQKFQMEMMAMYKKEKVNPMGGCLPILIQIPVFLAFYWALLESVEMRHAPFMLWLQDLSAPDPYYVLPVLMGLTQFLMTKLNPAPMDEIQKKVMMFMPIVLIFIFINFPQGLVLYWVVNNILSMAQQWYINKKFGA